jgi:hypothetical protein
MPPRRQWIAAAEGDYLIVDTVGHKELERAEMLVLLQAKSEAQEFPFQDSRELIGMKSGDIRTILMTFKRMRPSVRLQTSTLTSRHAEDRAQRQPAGARQRLATGR